MAHSERNEPCPCGSGLIYEDCCGLAATNASTGWIPRVIEGGLDDNGLSLGMDEMKAVVDRLIKEENDRPNDDFCGLSPTEMSGLLYHPFESPRTVEFNTDVKEIPPSPFMLLFLKLLNACEGKGMKLTAKGNLAQKFCREAALEYFTPDETYDEKFIIRTISSEPRFEELHTVNIIAKIAGYTRKYRGRLLLTKKGQQVAKKGISGKDFFDLFRKYTYDFNWAYRDGYEELRIVQTAFLFTLFILKKFGNIFRDPAFYEELFIKAFPMSLNEVPEKEYATPEKQVRRCYSLRSLERFCWFLGFTEFNDQERKFFNKSYQLKKTPFLDGFIKFHK